MLALRALMFRSPWPDVTVTSSKPAPSSTMLTTRSSPRSPMRTSACRAPACLRGSQSSRFQGIWQDNLNIL